MSSWLYGIVKVDLSECPQVCRVTEAILAKRLIALIACFPKNLEAEGSI